jgi:hypothetical protein
MEGIDMIELVFPGSLNVFRWWSRTFAHVMRGQWELLDAQYRAGIRVLDTLQDLRAAEEPELQQSPEDLKPERLDESKSLQCQTEERLQKGLAPPPAIYQAQNRNKIDWHLLPGWARPSDPELFEGGHEG